MAGAEFRYCPVCNLETPVHYPDGIIQVDPSVPRCYRMVTGTGADLCGRCGMPHRSSRRPLRPRENPAPGKLAHLLEPERFIREMFKDGLQPWQAQEIGRIAEALMRRRAERGYQPPRAE